MRRPEYLREALQDFRHALRQLRRRPGFAVVVISTLAVGIGATTAVFTTADHVLLRPLPYAAADRIVKLSETNLRTGARRGVAPGNYVEWKRRSSSFEHMGLAEPWGSDVARSDGPPQELPAWRVSEGFLEALGVEPIRGRAFVPEELAGTAVLTAEQEATGALQVHAGTGTSVLISEDLWTTQYGADPRLIGQTLLIDDVARTVVGVLATDIDFPEERPLWMPKLFTELELRERTASFMHVVARLRPGVSLAQAQDEMDRLAATLAVEFPDTNAETGVRLTGLDQEVLGEARPALLVLLGAVALVLLVACTNVVGLMLARSASRQREVSIRAALGAGRGRLVRQFLSESLAVAVLGGGLGVILATLGLRALIALAPASLPRLDTVELDSRVLAFAVAITLLSALVSGLVPALRASRASATAALKSGDRSGEGGQEGARMRSFLVVAEVAVALALLIGAGLLGRSFLVLLRSELGFETKDRAALQLYLWDRNPTPTQRIQRAAEMIRKMETVPGVRKVGLATALPFLPTGTNSAIPFEIDDRPAPASGQRLRARPNVASPEYFEVMSIPLLAGRPFSPLDRDDSPPVVLVNASLAKTFFPNEDPIGETITLSFGGGEREIVGIVGDARATSLDLAPEPEIFVPFAQSGWGGVIFVVETKIAVDSVMPQLRAAVWETDPGQAIYVSSTLESLVGDTLVQRRFNLVLLGCFAAVALLLAAIGLYGLISFSTSRRTHEIGIRMALGSRRGQVAAMVLGQGLRLGLVGVAAGVLLALLLTRFLEHMLYEVRPTDLATFLSLSAFMLLLTAAAAYVPARRASRLDPVKALRDE